MSVVCKAGECGDRNEAELGNFQWRIVAYNWLARNRSYYSCRDGEFVAPRDCHNVFDVDAKSKKKEKKKKKMKEKGSEHKKNIPTLNLVMT